MRYFTLLILFFSGFYLQAQENHLSSEREKVSWTIKAGWLQSDLKGNDLDFLAKNGKTDALNSFFAGIGIDNPIGSNFILKHELNFQIYGSEFTRELDAESIEADLKMYGLRINPISLGYRFADLHVFAGPYINVLLNSSITSLDSKGNKIKDRDIFGTEIDDQDGTHFLQNMDYGAVLGAEYHFDFGGILGISYSRGFASIFDNSNTYDNYGPDGPADLKIYNQQFSVYLGYKF